MMDYWISKILGSLIKSKTYVDDNTGGKYT